jgi:hypothetical protein
MPMITPRLTLFDLCGPGHVFNSRIPDNAAEWVFTAPGVADAVTGNQLTIVGRMPILCSAAVATDAGLALLRGIGFKLEAEIIPFTDSADRMKRMKGFSGKGLVFIDQHVQPDVNLHPGISWVESSRLSFLNKKSNLHEIVPPSYLPTRELCEPSSLGRYAKQLERAPRVIKAVTEKSSGTGRSVLLCRNESDLKRAEEFFGSCETVIVEKFIAMRRNLCLNYAVFPDGKIEYLGAADQIVDGDLNYLGNWLGPDNDPPTDLVKAGHEVMTSAWHRGYRGFAGFDAAVMDDGASTIYDLNFRFNGSTTPLLLYRDLLSRFGMPIAKFSAWTYSGRFDRMIALLKTAPEKYGFIPFSTYDPAASHNNRIKPRASALLFGRTRDEVHEKEKELNLLGFH